MVNVLFFGVKIVVFCVVFVVNFELEVMVDVMNLMGCLGDFECDIVLVVVFLVLEGSCYLIGNMFYVDGGGYINGVVWVCEFD